MAFVLVIIGLAVFTSLRVSPHQGPTHTPAATPSTRSFVDSASGVSFTYPASLILNEDPPESSKQLSFYVTAQAIDQIPDAPFWYGPDAAKAELAALTKGDLSKTADGTGVHRQLLSLPGGAVGATVMVLSEIECGSVMFTLEAHVYRHDRQILISLQDVKNKYDIIAANPSYFKVDSECTSDNQTRIWASPDTALNTFAADLVAGKTDAESQRWYHTFQQIVSSLSVQ